LTGIEASAIAKSVHPDFDEMQHQIEQIWYQLANRSVQFNLYIGYDGYVGYQIFSRAGIPPTYAVPEHQIIKGEIHIGRIPEGESAYPEDFIAKEMRAKKDGP